MRSSRRTALFPLASVILSLAVTLAAGCGEGGNDQDPDDHVVLPEGDILVRLQALPHVVSVTEMPTDNAPYRYFAIEFEQPVDHDHPDGATFIQHISLIHRAEEAPMVLATTGYADWIYDNATEPTALLGANQLSVEQRYFLPSRPVPTDWSFLRVAQAAADHHAISRSFHHLYATGPWVSTGASKGGMTSIYHRRFYPDDVDATLAYVAPHSIAAGDTRYDGWFDTALPADCVQRLHALQVDILTNRRQAMIDRESSRSAADPGTVYGRVTLPAAVESAVVDMEWSFFQFYGQAFCADIPGPDVDDDIAWNWLSNIGDPSGLSDASLAVFEPYYYQAEAELGYPKTEQPHLDALLQFGPDDYAGTEPPGDPTYDPSTMIGVADWVRNDAERILFLYGEWDPWVAGAFDLGDNAQLQRYTVAQGNHGSQISNLAPADQSAALATIEAWTGVTPHTPAPGGQSPVARRRAAADAIADAADPLARLEARTAELRGEPRLSLHALRMLERLRATAR